MSMNNRSRRQSGLSMIELLVALAISSFLILGITQIYLDNKRNYLFQQGQAGNQENGRFAMMFLDQQLAKVGFRRRADDPNEFAFPAQRKPPIARHSKPARPWCPPWSRPARADSATAINRRQAKPTTAKATRSPPPATHSLPPRPSPHAFCSFPRPPMPRQPRLLRADNQGKGQEIVSGLVDFKLEYGVGPTMAGKREVESFVEQANIADRPVRALRYRADGQRQEPAPGRQQDPGRLDHALPLVQDQPARQRQDRLYQIAKGSQTLRNLVP